MEWLKFINAIFFPHNAEWQPAPAPGRVTSILTGKPISGLAMARYIEGQWQYRDATTEEELDYWNERGW